MLGEILVWWVRQMRSLLPGWATRRSVATDATIIAVAALGDDKTAAFGTVLARRDGHESVIAPLDFRRPLAAPRRAPATGLRLPARMVLQREVSLPLAAERDLATVLGYEMDRLTPFETKEVFWGVTGLRREPARGLRLTLMVVKRAPVEHLLQALAAIGLRPSFLEGATGRIELAATGRAGWTSRNGLYGLCGVLALVCMAVPPIRQQIALERGTRQIAAQQPAWQEAMRLRQRVAIAEAGQAALAAARRDGDALQVLAALTTALPDGTWLGDLTLKAGDLTVDGRSTDAARLIGRLTAIALFHNPQFTAPVTRASDGTEDQFSIHLTVAR